MSRPPFVAIVGATGAVGAEIVQCLERRRFPLSGLRLLASARSAGRTLPFNGRPLPIQALDAQAFEGVNIAIFAAGGAVAREFAPIAVRAGSVVIDNSSAFRMQPDVPLVVPEINGAGIASHRGIIANPNCVAVIGAMALWPLHVRSSHRVTAHASRPRCWPSPA